jgi:hypothetical protein
MRSRLLQAQLTAAWAQSVKTLVDMAPVVAFAVFLSLVGTAQALEPGTGQYDINNTYKNVGIYMFTNVSDGQVAAYASGVLIHERVFMTAAHATGWNVRGVAPFLRIVVSFSVDPTREPSTWMDTTAHLVHPTFPYQECIIQGPYYPGECPPWSTDQAAFARAPLVDIGLVVLARPVTDIAPATLAPVNDLADALGQRMTFVGYGCVPTAVRNFGAGTVAMLSEGVAWYNADPASEIVHPWMNQRLRINRTSSAH